MINSHKQLSQKDLGNLNFFANYRLKMVQGLRHGQRIHLAPNSLARFQGSFQVMARNLNRQGIGNHLARAIRVLHPCRMWQSDPHRPTIHQKLDVHGVSVAGGDSNDQCLINAVDFFFRPSVHRMEILIHKKTISEQHPAEQTEPDNPPQSHRDIERRQILLRQPPGTNIGALNCLLVFSVALCLCGGFMMGRMKNLGILLSGRGSNFEAIAKNVAKGEIPNARISVVISNRADAGGIATAQRLGITSVVIASKGKEREAHDREVAAVLQRHNTDLVCLAGYMRLLSPWFVRQFPHRILNIHPSLLPAFPGLEAQEQAFAYGVKVSGCTVHFVDEELDHGPIIVQKTIAVLDTDDEHSLSARILEQEHIAYSEAINIVLEGKFKVLGRRLVNPRSNI